MSVHCFLDTQKIICQDFFEISALWQKAVKIPFQEKHFLFYKRRPLKNRYVLAYLGILFMDALGYFQENLAIRVNAKIRFLKKVRILVGLLIIIFFKSTP